MTEIKRILLAEDNIRDVELTLEALADNSLANEVIVVRDGQEALDYLRRQGPFSMRASGNPVVVLLDLKMPKVNGIEVLKLMKADPILRTIPVVVLTSSREEKDLEECYQHGVNAYVVKPVQFDEFMSAIREIGVFWAIINEPPLGGSSLPKPD